jgi:energy-coupling factor transport system permease protein
MMQLRGLNYAKAQTDEFQKAFGLDYSKTPIELSDEDVQKRVNYIGEELVEALAAVSTNNATFFSAVTDLIDAIIKAENKSIKNKDVNAKNKLVALADAFTDINYFTQGTFSMMGVEPQPLFDIVQEANMSKLGPDGKPIRREGDGKVMKPEGWEAPEPKLAAEIEKQIKLAEGK